MPQRIVITGSRKTECLRVREVLRQRFKQAIIHVNEGPIAALPKDGILIVADPLERSPLQTEEATDLEKKVQRAEFLVETARIFSSSDTQEAMLKEVIAKTKGVLGDLAFVVLMDEGQPHLQCATATDPEHLIRILISVMNLRPQILERHLQRILKSGETLFIRDLSTAELPEEIRGFVKTFDLKSIVAAPVRRGEKIFGAFVSISSGSEEMDEGQVLLSQELSQTMASAIENARLIAELRESANTDALTGLYNARFFNEVIVREVARSERHQLPMSLMLIDVDDFKRVNDLHGHLAGDEALISVARILRQSIRISDFVFRRGGDEFCILLPGTELEGGFHAAENIRSRVEAASLLHAAQPERNITISIGIATHETGSTPNALMSRADQALYRAKELSKNRVEAQHPAGIKDKKAGVQD
jgi:diguanylate cyclase (GGDEF)-like protein